MCADRLCKNKRVCKWATSHERVTPTRVFHLIYPQLIYPRYIKWNLVPVNIPGLLITFLVSKKNIHT